MPPNQSTKELEMALSSGLSFHPLTSFFPEDEKHGINNRIKLYKSYWEAYSATAKITTDDVSEDSDINFCRLAVHKSTDWLFGKSWSLHAPPGNEAILEQVAEIWDDNEKDLTCQLCGHKGAVTGDVYLQVTYRNGQNAQDGFVITPISAQYVYPVFDPFMPRKLIGAMVQFPVSAVNHGRDGLKAHVASINHLSTNAFKTYYTQYITDSEIAEYYGDTRIAHYPNPFGEINIFHAQNIITGASPFGESDLADLVKMDRNLTRISDKISETIDYHSGPTTVITGASAEQLESGANNLWSIRSEKAKVYQLTTTGDLAGAGAHFERLKGVRSEVSEIPLPALGGANISVASSAALEVLFMPLLEKTRRKRISYGYLIRQVSSFLARQLLADQKSLIRKLSDKNNPYKFGVKWASPIPRDETEHLKNVIQQFNAKLISQAEAVMALADDSVDIQDRFLKIIADERAATLLNFEKFKAAEGNVPNITSVRTNSVGLSLSDQELLDEQDDLIFNYAEKMEQVAPKENDLEDEEQNKPPAEVAGKSSKEDKDKNPPKESNNGKVVASGKR